MARRIFEVAKELGVDSKAIVAKCQAEGIPETVVKNHMSTLTAGLEATIREWFSGAGGAATAVETSEKIDLDKVKVRKSRSRAGGAGGKGDAEGDDAGGSVATATQASPAAPARAATTTPAPSIAPHTGSATSGAAPATGTQLGTQLGETSAPAAKAASIAPSGVSGDAAATRVPARPAPATTTPATTTNDQSSRATVRPPTPMAPTSTPTTPARAASAPAAGQTATPEAPVARPAAGIGHGIGHGPTPTAPPRHEPGEAVRPAASVPGGSAAHSAPSPAASSPSSAPARMAPPPPPARTVTPAPMNVPQRPTSVSPAGPKLEVKTPVKLSGPKVVRVEAPENIAPPRPRGPRPPMGGPGMRSGGGAGAGGGDDDRSRSPRRKDAPGSAAAKRSSGAGVPERRRGRSDADWIGTTQGIYSEQDLIEREARLARAGGFLKKRKQELSKPGQGGAGAIESDDHRVRISAPFTIKDLSAATGVKAADIVKKLFLQGVMATINSAIDPEKALEVMLDFDVELEITEAKTAEQTVSDQFVKRDAKDLRSRWPVVTILGHVDHGKTSLLDKIRNAKVAAGEAGGITQKTSAFVTSVEVEGNTKQVVFLDTPGHEAFTGMRSRGAKLTDVVVLVVSAPEGVMPQTIESINHARAAKVPLVVALNKVDRPDATENQIQKTLGELAKAGVNPVDWGGDTEVVRVSAVTGVGLQQLLETLDYQAQLLDLKADFSGPAQGTVIEAKMEEGRGAVANILIQQGKLKVGDFVVMGRAFGRVRDITDDSGKRIKEAMPPMPVQVSGVDLVCDAGDTFYVTPNLRQAEEAAEQRRTRERQASLAQPKLTLDSLFSAMQTPGSESEVKEIRIVLKTDQQGTVDVLKAECEKIKTDEVKVRVIDAGVGGITESNVLLADASKAIIVGFNVIPSGKARQLAEQKGVEIRTYEVIYNIVDDLRKAAEGMLSPDVREEILGHAEVRQVFRISKVGAVAGCYITDGTVQRDALIRVTRNDIVIERDRKLAQLRRVKDDVKDVRAGMECGMKIDGYDDIKDGDILECYKKVEVKRTL